MPDLTIDRLMLRVPVLSEAAARRLGALVADGLAAANLPERSTSAAALSLRLAGAAGESVEALAGRIVRELLRSLTRSM